MLRIAPAVVPLFLSLACACASAPTRPATDQPATGEPARRAAATRASENVDDVNPTLQSNEPVIPLRDLGPGRCVDGFDCSDTVGLPPSGYRWDCVRGKCERARLPSVGGVQQTPDSNTAKAEPEKKVKARKARRRSR